MANHSAQREGKPRIQGYTVVGVGADRRGMTMVCTVHTPWADCRENCHWRFLQKPRSRTNNTNNLGTVVRIIARRQKDGGGCIPTHHIG